MRCTPGVDWQAGPGKAEAVCRWTVAAGPNAGPGPLVPPIPSTPAGTGGAGRYHGGDGVVRELEFLRPLTASILSERRAVRPFGLLGGGSAAPGLNLWIKRDGRVVSLGAKATVEVEGGDRIQILTPGGGGYGPPEAAADGGEEQQHMEGEAGAALAQAVSSKVEAKRRRTGGGEFSAPVRDGGSVAAYVRNQETV